MESVYFGHVTRGMEKRKKRYLCRTLNKSLTSIKFHVISISGWIRFLESNFFFFFPRKENFYQFIKLISIPRKLLFFFVNLLSTNDFLYSRENFLLFERKGLIKKKIRVKIFPFEIKYFYSIVGNFFFFFLLFFPSCVEILKNSHKDAWCEQGKISCDSSFRIFSFFFFLLLHSSFPFSL